MRAAGDAGPGDPTAIGVVLLKGRASVRRVDESWRNGAGSGGSRGVRRSGTEVCRRRQCRPDRDHVWRLDYQPMALTAHDAQLAEQLKAIRVAGLHRVPGTAVQGRRRRGASVSVGGAPRRAVLQPVFADVDRACRGADECRPRPGAVACGRVGSRWAVPDGCRGARHGRQTCRPNRPPWSILA